MTDIYKVKKLKNKIDTVVEVPGSKSITNRALLISALSNGTSILEKPLFSDDTESFIASLKALGFQLEVGQDFIEIEGSGGQIPFKEASINVASAGTTARFLTAFLAISDGDYKVDASDQMKKRPMEPLFKALEEVGADITYLEEEYHLPVDIKGSLEGKESQEVSSDTSTQFLSALMLIGPLLASRNKSKTFTVRVSGARGKGAYVLLTKKMMEQFGADIKLIEEADIVSYVIGAKPYEARTYNIEPDLSAAGYFYAAAAVSGGKVLVKGVHKDSLQGDIKFLYLLEKMGATLEEKEEGILLTGPYPSKLKGITVDMKDYSDQTMTLAAIAPFCMEAVKIRNIAHIRGQESDRIRGICKELTKLGIKVLEYEDGIDIYPDSPKASLIETYDDHRMAMAFAITGLMVDGIEIKNPTCCYKTFKEYFTVLEKLYK